MNNPMHDLSELSDVPTITMDENLYKPSSLEVQPGSIIKVINNDSGDHTITAENGVFDLEISAGSESELIPPSERGVYPFFCRYHSEMTGQIVVK